MPKYEIHIEDGPESQSVEVREIVNAPDTLETYTVLGRREQELDEDGIGELLDDCIEDFLRLEGKLS